MDAINSGDDSDHDIISAEMLEDIRDGSHTHKKNIRREYVINYVIVLGKSNWNGKER